MVKIINTVDKTICNKFKLATPPPLSHYFLGRLPVLVIHDLISVRRPMTHWPAECDYAWTSFRHSRLAVYWKSNQTTQLPDEHSQISIVKYWFLCVISYQNDIFTTRCWPSKDLRWVRNAVQKKNLIRKCEQTWSFLILQSNFPKISIIVISHRKNLIFWRYESFLLCYDTIFCCSSKIPLIFKAAKYHKLFGKLVKYPKKNIPIQNDLSGTNTISSAYIWHNSKSTVPWHRVMVWLSCRAYFLRITFARVDPNVICWK